MSETGIDLLQCDIKWVMLWIAVSTYVAIFPGLFGDDRKILLRSSVGNYCEEQ